MFVIYTTASEIHDTVDLVLGIKIFVELDIHMRELKVKFFNRAISVLPSHKEMV